MDGGSVDKTIEIARSYGAKVCKGGSLAERRLRGTRLSSGQFILMMDSDQVLHSEAISDCLQTYELFHYDALILEETSLSTKTLVQRAFFFDRYLVHKLSDSHPVFGTLLPRFFRSEFIQRVSWPINTMANDHAFIHYACWRGGAKIGRTPAKIFHHDPESISTFARKFYHWGYYYILEVSDNPSVAITHALPRRAYISKTAIGNPLIVIIGLLYSVKIMSAGLGAFVSISESLRSKARTKKPDRKLTVKANLPCV
jgi:glycosyltransferase involved in cell wall biosynthesis